LLLPLFATSALAGAGRKLGIYASAGPAIHVSPDDLAYRYDNGFGSRISVGVELSSAIRILGSFNLDSYDLDKHIPNDGPTRATVEDSGTSNLYLTGGIKVNGHKFPVKSVQPYLMGGAGYLRSSRKSISHFNEQPQRESFKSENGLALLVGGGVDVSIGILSKAFIEAYYLIAITESNKSSGVPMRVGLSYYFELGS
jgi:hypothetical protein